MDVVKAVRYHDISCGHRVYGHESKCQYLHGHNYRITFFCEPMVGLDQVGRVIDFSIIKSLLCMWVENVWDHHFLVWEQDPLVTSLQMLDETVVAVPFNPTAENMALHLLNVVGPSVLKDTGVKLVEVSVEETRKCSASASIKGIPAQYYEGIKHG